MIRMTSALVLLAWAGIAPLSSGEPPKKAPVRPVVSWKGVVEDGARRDKIRASVVTDQANLKSLWAALGKGGEVPDVDFGRAFVVVQTSGDQILSIDFEVDDKGNLTGGKGTAAELKGKGFSYFVGVFMRDGAKSYDGKPIQAPR